MTTSLPIERKPEILQEYGRAFACINLVESVINLILQTNAGFSNPDPKLDEFTLGKKIALAQKFLSKELKQDLWELNKKRILLAHGITMVGDKDSITIMHKQNSQEFSKEFLNQTVILAKALCERIVKENHQAVKSKNYSA